MIEKKEKIIFYKGDATMQVKFKGCKTGQKINISMVIPTGEQKTVITMEMPQGGDWRADMECYDKVLSAYEERLNKAMQSASTATGRRSRAISITIGGNRYGIKIQEFQKGKHNRFNNDIFRWKVLQCNVCRSTSRWRLESRRRFL